MITYLYKQFAHSPQNEYVRFTAAQRMRKSTHEKSGIIAFPATKPVYALRCLGQVLFCFESSSNRFSQILGNKNVQLDLLAIRRISILLKLSVCFALNS